ncbi:hypothetical protein GE09DRAFT_787647 [Coniochaeta sp. 2T2.1]|nr:hypothetical protein GE09DRAFT_787647 [Coniochaeta sp. 2T2.1]
MFFSPSVTICWIRLLACSSLLLRSMYDLPQLCSTTSCSSLARSEDDSANTPIDIVCLPLKSKELKLLLLPNATMASYLPQADEKAERGGRKEGL